MNQAIVITGVGPVSPIGIGWPEFTASLASRRSAIGPVTRFAVPNEYPTLAAEIRDFKVNDYLDSAKTYLDPTSAYLLAGCSLALKDAALDLGQADKTRIGVSVGSCYGALQTSDTYNQRLVEKGPRFASSLLFSHTYINTPASLVAIEWGLMGFNAIYASGMASGGDAIAYAADALALGRADAILAGGTDGLCELLYLGLASQDRTSLASSVGELAAHAGLVPAEGCGVVLLETGAAAHARGARVRGELIGTGLGMDRSPATALKGAVELALDTSGLGSVDLVISPANGEPEIEDACQTALPSCRTVRPKDLQGETFAAAAGLDLAAALALGQPGETALVCSVDPTGNACALIVRVGGG